LGHYRYDLAYTGGLLACFIGSLFVQVKTLHNATTVLSELKQHPGIESDFCYPSPEKIGERETSTYELPLLRRVHDQKASEANGTGLRNLLLLSMPTDLQ
jgi:hypothetical protein